MEVKKMTVEANQKVFPDWFKEQAGKGRAKIVYNDDNQIDHIVVISPTTRTIAFPGDTIMNLKTGMSVVSKEQARKFRVQRSAGKTENE